MTLVLSWYVFTSFHYISSLIRSFFRLILLSTGFLSGIAQSLRLFSSSLCRFIAPSTSMRVLFPRSSMIGRFKATDGLLSRYVTLRFSLCHWLIFSSVEILPGRGNVYCSNSASHPIGSFLCGRSIPGSLPYPRRVGGFSEEAPQTPHSKFIFLYQFYSSLYLPSLAA